MLISIIIPTLNEETNLENLLRQLNQLKKKIPFEIIVVDGGSQDSTAAIASDYAQVYQLKEGNRGLN
ncbi:glycosyltransferase [Enterococcus avium]